MLTTKLFLILLLTGALSAEKTTENAPEKATDCVEKLEEGEKYYIKLEGPNKDYGYAFGNRAEADKLRAVPLQVKNAGIDILTTPDVLGIQEFTFKDDTLYAEIEENKKVDTKTASTVRYYVGLKNDDRFGLTTSMNLKSIDKKLYVSKNEKKLRSKKVVLKDRKLFIVEEATGTETEIQYSAISSAKKSTICLVTKETANRDYVTMVEERIYKLNADTFNSDTEVMKTVTKVRVPAQLSTLQAPFNEKKSDDINRSVWMLLEGLKLKSEALVKNSAEVSKILDESKAEISEEEVQKDHLLEYEPFLGSDKKENEKVNGKFNKDDISKLVFGKMKIDKNKLGNFVDGAKKKHDKNKNTIDQNDLLGENDGLSVANTFEERLKHVQQEHAKGGDYDEEDANTAKEIFEEHRDQFENNDDPEYLGRKHELVMKYLKILGRNDDENKENLRAKYDNKLRNQIVKEKIFIVENPNLDPESVRAEFIARAAELQSAEEEPSNNFVAIASASAFAAILFFL